jgi:hypothetical protein
MLTITSVLIVLSLLFGGTGAVVVASQDSLPGDALYGVKMTTEDFHFRFTKSEEAKLDLALEYANRRMLEAGLAAQSGQMVTNRHQKIWTERLAENLKDALLAVAAMEDSETGLAKIKAQIHIWDVVDYKRDQARDGTYNAEVIDPNAFQHMFQHMFKNMLGIVDDGLENPQQFKQTFAHRFGSNAEELDLLAAVDDPEPLPVDDSLVDEKEGQQIKAGEGKSYGPGPDDAQYMPQNSGDDTPFGFKGSDGETGGPGPGEPAGSGDSDQNQGSSGSQNQSGKQP